MTPSITHYEILRNEKVAPDGMVSGFVLRNLGAMKRQGLIDARKRQQLTQEAMAERMGVSTPQISRWENGKDGIPSQRIPSMVEAYGASVQELLGDEGLAPPSNALVQPFEGASASRMRQDLPILGTALGGECVIDGVAIEQTHLYSDGDVIYAKRPPVLDGRADAYGIYTQGSSMEPVHMDGSLLLVETKRPPRVGDDVLVYLRRNGEDQEQDDGQSARTVLVKRLVKRSASFVELEQFNPAGTFKVAMQDVLKIHRVMTLADLLS